MRDYQRNNHNIQNIKSDTSRALSNCLRSWELRLRRDSTEPNMALISGSTTKGTVAEGGIRARATVVCKFSSSFLNRLSYLQCVRAAFLKVSGTILLLHINFVVSYVITPVGNINIGTYRGEISTKIFHIYLSRTLRVLSTTQAECFSPHTTPTTQ